MGTLPVLLAKLWSLRNDTHLGSGKSYHCQECDKFGWLQSPTLCTRIDRLNKPSPRCYRSRASGAMMYKDRPAQRCNLSDIAPLSVDKHPTFVIVHFPRAHLKAYPETSL
jgi:hypothetical protein